jgi:hypothetical protein
MMVLDLEGIQKYRIWEQYSLSGKRHVPNYGKLLSYLSDVRRIQRELGCGRIYSSTFLGVEPKPNTINKKFVLVIELLPARGATYENKPISLVKIIVGGGKRERGAYEEGQVILHLKDLQTRQFRKTFVFNTDSPIETVKPLLEDFYKDGLMPIKSSDYYFGQYKPELQYVFDNVVDRLDEKEIEQLKGLLSDYGFTFIKDTCRKTFGQFVLRIYRKNMYGSFILAFQDLEDKISIHWALKGNDLKEAIDAILVTYERWKEDTKTRDDT